MQKPESIPADSVCTHPRGFVGPCVLVHGRVMTYSDNYTVGLWKIGTGRLLGIQNEIDKLDFPVQCSLPREIYVLLADAKIVYAEFVMRPLTRDEPDVKQFACIASASHIVAHAGGLDHPLFHAQRH